MESKNLVACLSIFDKTNGRCLFENFKKVQIKLAKMQIKNNNGKLIIKNYCFMDDGIWAEHVFITSVGQHHLKDAAFVFVYDRDRDVAKGDAVVGYTYFEKLANFKSGVDPLEQVREMKKKDVLFPMDWDYIAEQANYVEDGRSGKNDGEKIPLYPQKNDTSPTAEAAAEVKTMQQQSGDHLSSTSPPQQQTQPPAFTPLTHEEEVELYSVLAKRDPEKTLEFFTRDMNQQKS
jgi:hypothetical protein